MNNSIMALEKYMRKQYFENISKKINQKNINI